MKKQVVMLSALALTSTLLIGCADGSNYVRPRTVGAVAGGVGGGALGHAITGGNTAGTIAGAVGGTFVGYQLGKSYERRR